LPREPHSFLFSRYVGARQPKHIAWQFTSICCRDIEVVNIFLLSLFNACIVRWNGPVFLSEIFRAWNGRGEIYVRIRYKAVINILHVGDGRRRLRDMDCSHKFWKSAENDVKRLTSNS
jgi:hypothetical protein